MNELGSRIRRLRMAKRWTQTQLALKAGIHQTTLSRIEQGDAAADEVIQGVAKALSADARELLALAQFARQAARITGADRNTKPLRIGVPHAISAAPFLALAYHNVPENVFVCSYGVKDPKSVEPVPFMYGPRPRNSAAQSTPSFLPNRPVLNDVKNWDDGVSFSLFAAGDLLDLLDEGKVDGIVVASDIYERNAQRLVRCAQIVRSAHACKVITVTEKATEGELWGDIRSKGARVFYYRNTIADVIVNELVRKAEGSKFELQPRVLSDWKNFMENQLIPEIQSGRFPLVVVAWEPHLTWLLEAIKIKDLSCKVDYVPAAVFGSGIETEVAFDLLFPIRTVDEWLTPSGPLVTLIDRVTQCANDISRRSSPDATLINDVAHYLSMTTDRCRAAIDVHRFEVLYYPDWVNRLFSVMRKKG